MADGGCYQAEGPLLALSWLTRVTGIWLGGCLAVCTLGSCAPTFPPPFAPWWPHTTPFSLKQGTMQAFPDNLCPCATSRGMPCTKILSLAHLAHASWPPRRLVIVLLHSLWGGVITCSNHATVKLIYYKSPIFYNCANHSWKCVFLTFQAAIDVHSFFLFFNQIRFSEHERSFPGTHSNTLTQLHTFTPGSCPGQSQLDLLVTEEPIWGRCGLSALHSGTSGVAVKEGKFETRFPSNFTAMEHIFSSKFQFTAKCLLLSLPSIFPRK